MEGFDWGLKVLKPGQEFASDSRCAIETCFGAKMSALTMENPIAFKSCPFPNFFNAISILRKNIARIANAVQCHKLIVR